MANSVRTLTGLATPVTFLENTVNSRSAAHRCGRRLHRPDDNFNGSTSSPRGTIPPSCAERGNGQDNSPEKDRPASRVHPGQSIAAGAREVPAAHLDFRTIQVCPKDSPGRLQQGDHARKQPHRRTRGRLAGSRHGATGRET